MTLLNVESKAWRRFRLPPQTNRAHGARRMANNLSSVCRIVPFAAAALLFAPAARASDRTLQLLDPPPVAKEAAAMPLIAGPSDEAERRINAALKRLDLNLGKAIRACKGQTAPRATGCERSSRP